MNNQNIEILFTFYVGIVGMASYYIISMANDYINLSYYYHVVHKKNLPTKKIFAVRILRILSITLMIVLGYYIFFKHLNITEI
jgi:hypothetical protein